MFILALCMGAVSVLSIDRLTGEHEAENMNRVAENQREIINMQLLQAEDVTNFVASDISRRIDKPEELRDKTVRRNLSADMDYAFQNAVSNVESVCSYFVYYAEDLAGTEDNLWRVRPLDWDFFEERQLQPVSLFAADDVRHTNWYTMPVESGQPAWVPPYYSEVQQRYLLSYVIPIFKQDELVAVVGVDIDFLLLLQRIEKVPAYASGKAFCTDLSGKIHYTAENPDGIEAGRNGQLALEGERSFFAPENSSEALVRYRWNGVEYDTTSVSLRNGLALMVAAPVQEIYAHAFLKILQLTFVFFVMVLIFAAVSIALTRRMTSRLQALTGVANEIAGGNLDVKFPTGGRDEISDLSRALGHTTGKLKKTLAEMEYLTYHDSLTGLLNRLGLDKYIRERWDKSQTAVLMSLDIDDFKLINDLYGHDAGDVALQKVAELLTAAFGRQMAVARNGGDEFIVLLQDVTLSKAEQLIDKFCQQPKAYMVRGEVYSFTVSVGYSTYPQQADSLGALFRQADEALYAVKLRGKNGCGAYETEVGQLARSQLGFNLRSVSKNLPVGILIYKMDEVYTLLYANEMLLRLADCDTVGALQKYLNSSVLNLLAPEEVSAFRADKRNEQPCRYQLRSQQGQLRPVVLWRRLVNHPLYGEICYGVVTQEL